MSDFILTVLRDNSYTIELLIGSVLFMHVLEKRSCFLLRVLFSVALCGGGSILSYILLPNFFSPPAMLIMLLAVVCIFVFCCRISLADGIYGAFCVFAVQHFYSSFYLLLLYSVGAGSWERGWLTPIHLVALVSSYVLFYFLFARRLPEQGHYNVDLKLAVVSTILTLFIAAVLSLMVKRYGQRDIVFLICQVYAMICCFFLLWIQVRERKHAQVRVELETQRQLWMQRRDQYELSKRNIDLINQKCHDLKHQVAVLRTIDREDVRETWLQEIEKSVMIYDCAVKTGNEVLDTVLTEKSLLCEQQGITWTCMADGRRLDFMNAVDLYSILGNALDNAIESVRSIEDPARRVIAVTLHGKEGLVILQVENYYQGPLTFQDGLPATQKAGEYHG